MARKARLVAWIKPQVKKAVQMYAIEHDMTVQEVVECCLRSILEQHPELAREWGKGKDKETTPR